MRRFFFTRDFFKAFAGERLNPTPRTAHRNAGKTARTVQILIATYAFPLVPAQILAALAVQRTTTTLRQMNAKIACATSHMVYVTMAKAMVTVRLARVPMDFGGECAMLCSAWVLGSP